VSTWEPIPSEIYDTDEAIAAANAAGGSDFLAQFPMASVEIDGRKMPDIYPDFPDNYIWRILYTYDDGAGKTQTEYMFEAAVDMETGEVLFSSTNVATDQEEQPVSFTITGTYPNPFNATLTISLTLQQPVSVTLKVYNTLGQEVATLIQGPLSAGEHRVRWRPEELPSGLYFVRVQAGGRTMVRSVMHTQ